IQSRQRVSCMHRGFCASVLAVLVLCHAPARAAIITYVTPGGSTTGGQSVSASALFTTSTNQVTIFLENLQANPVSAVQCLSGLSFTLDTGEILGTLSSSVGVQRSIIGNGTYTDGASVATGWALATVAASLKVDLLGTSTAPKNTIVGPPDGANKYSAGNNSVTGGSHNPHLGLNATFTISVPGVTSNSQVSSAVFQFNTSAGNTVVGQQGGVVPEPAAGAVLALGAIAFLRRNR
ncbi:MAG: hypothetical protein ACREJC_05735, partial [Tepidisphaeraceae bacterium]